MDLYGYINLLNIPGAEICDMECSDGVIRRGVFVPDNGKSMTIYKRKMARVSMFFLKAKPNINEILYRIILYIPRIYYRKYIEENGSLPELGRIKLRTTRFKVRYAQKDNIDDIIGEE